MRIFLVLLLHLVTSVAKLIGPVGTKALIAESLLLKHQLLIVNRTRHRAPNLTSWDRVLFGLCSLFMKPNRIRKAAAVLSSVTLLKFHEAMKGRKNRRLFSSGGKRKPGPKGPSQQLIEVIVEMKRRNPRFGCPKIAQQISKAFGIEIDKDVVRRVLAQYYRSSPENGGLSWLTFIGHMKDSLWSVDLFRCESINLRTHWV